MADFERYENDAEWPAKFSEGDLVIHCRSNRKGKVRRRRWEHGNRSWGYSVLFEDGVSTMALEEWLSVCKKSKES